MTKRLGTQERFKGHVGEHGTLMRHADRGVFLGIYKRGLHLTLVSVLVWMVLASAVHAGPGPCTVNPAGVVTCTGNQSQGIASGVDFFTPPITTLNVNTLSGSITPASGTEGIVFRNTAGSGLTLNIGTIQDYLAITTQGNNASGIVSSSKGVTGADGVDGWIIIPGGPVPTKGGVGSDGGAIHILHYGGISTNGDSSAGIMAVSEGGTGGEGGYGGDYYNGRQGGTGGTGGTITINGSGTIHTYDTLSSGIAALSAGGAGGTGGGASGAMSGGMGGFGGKGGTVNVNGSWTITTEADKSHGIWAKSLGGSSGAGGSGGWLFGKPGSGGEASDGGTVTVTNGGHIVTHGSESYGIYAQSIGGFGGSGGTSFGLLWSFGGDGGSAGSGGSISVTNTSSGVIETSGDGSHGIFAQSIGGGGGGGGGMFALFTALGGDGGSGGYGGSVSVTNQGQISTTGNGSHGIFAQSIGGGGGSSTGSVSLVQIGGSGTGGGYGDYVSVTNSGSITTSGDGSYGIFAQSIGGGGGSGGDSVGAVSIGGSGAGSDDGGDVTIENTGEIITAGKDADAIFAQSIGGGGGSGGSSVGAISVGGFGEGGGDGGAVTITNSGIIGTQRDNSSGIFAQSIGGGGGSGGSSVGAISVGSFGIGGGRGGAVSVTNAGSISTQGAYSDGIFAQSVGGGGGIGTGVVGLVSMGAGGDQGGGDASAVTVTNSDSISTQGGDSNGIFAQSVGGGGGYGSFSLGLLSMNFSSLIGNDGDGEGGAVTVTNSGVITTLGTKSNGIIAQSVGGGGGYGRMNFGLLAADISASIGGAGSGNGGAVSVTNSGIISTRGDESDGIFAQSIGGSGGTGILEQLSSPTSAFISIGGSGSVGGAGSTVNVDNTGLIETRGSSANGIFAQSVGGGGGAGNFTISEIVSIGGSGGSGGDGGDVTVTNSGFISTLGTESNGIIAQSVGGGGGSSGNNVSLLVNVGGSGGSSGNGGTVTVANSGSISTQGDTSHGIFAESLGGGGGSIFTDDGNFDWSNAAFDVGLLVSIGGQTASSGAGGDVTVTNSGAITTLGDGSDGIFAHSVGGGGGTGSFIIGGGAVEVASNIGSGGDGTGGAVTVTNSGVITTMGNESDGIFAQSVGGGGGDGRFSLGVISISENFTGLIGNDGGGNGGAVSVSNSSDISTQGDKSRGIFAQSVGGSGGKGTSVLSASIGIQCSGASALGGAGGSGGNGATVDVTNSGVVLTLGSGSDGIFAQSIGGGGGEGGTSVAASEALSLLDFFNFNQSISIGGSGGAGGRGDAVDIENSGTIETQGGFSNGILGQSVGGGGGNGGNSINFTYSVNTSFNRDISIGGAGGDGGGGGSVNISSSGSEGIITRSDFSNGILAQSVGGGGGNGGDSMLGSIDLKIFLPEIPGADKIPTLDITGSQALSLGGEAGGGGSGGNVTVGNGLDTVLMTLGDFSNGILAQSVGGGGGNGGNSDFMTYDINVMSASIPTEWKDFIGIPAIKGTYSSSVGGSGGAGGIGGTINADNSGVIATQGDNSDGILAQSVGGGGGNGGSSITVSVAENIATATIKLAPDVNISYASSVGGSGGTGGLGGVVNVDSSGAILTLGNNSDGIVAQSIGGGGGSGGSSVTFSSEQNILNYNSPNIGISISESLGGQGETGGVGGAVEVDNSGSIETHGISAIGIIAQSIGGGGGTGGSSTNTSSGQGILTDSYLSIKLNFAKSIGASGDNGGNAGTVSIANSGSILTFGDESIGILAQSVGGGGGSGGTSMTVGAEQGYVNNSSPIVSVAGESSVGGSGGTGGRGNTVNAENSGAVLTQGSNSAGIVAQSIGGGGGNGGSSIAIRTKESLLNTLLPRLEASYSESIGGQGGSGGLGGDVSLSNSGTVSTMGGNSIGIIAQSVGGGGGNGGSCIAADVDGTAFEIVPTLKFSGTISQSLGGNGGAGNNAGSATVESAGEIATQGEYSHGIVAQSIGGGGGTGGSSIKVKVDATKLDIAPTLVLSGSLELSVGGKGGAAGDGGEASVTNSGLITTAGAFAGGIMAQSVGSGGGAGGVSLDVSADMKSLANVPNLSMNVGLQMGLTLGGEGGAGGSGADVTVANSGVIVTEGGFAPGIVAQSVGGGGGVAGYLATMSASVAGTTLEDIRSSIEAGSLAITLRSNPGSSGNGGDVTVTNSAPIVTLGAFAPGIVAQSVGGGGGIAGISNEYGVSSAILGAATQGSLLETSGGGLWFGGSVGGSGSAGDVTVTNSGDIITLGAFSHGIFAQSAGGTGSAGMVSVTNSGTILAEGADSDGVLAQSTGGIGGGNITVNIISGIISGGTGSGVGVRLLDGSSNSVTNYGEIMSNAGIDGMAIYGTGGNETISNYGIISGNVDLGAGSNGITNAKGAIFNSGASVLIGAGNLLSNSGMLAPGGMNTVHTSAIHGNMVQSASGVYAVDLDLWTNTADRVNLTGTSQLSGTAALTLLNSSLLSSGANEVTILSAAAGTTPQGLTLVAPSSLVIHYDLLYPNPTDVVLRYSADFVPEGNFTPNQSSVGDYINRMLSGGGSAALAPVIDRLLSFTDVSQFRWAYDRLSPEPYLSEEADTFFSTLQFHDAMLSCREREGSYRFVSDRSCAWFRMDLQRIQQKSSTEYFGFKRDAFSAAGGGQLSVNDNWHVGAALAYEHSLTDIRDFASSEGDQIQAGVVAKGRFGGTTVSVSAGGGYGWHEMTRKVDMPVPGTWVQGSHSIRFAASHVKIGHAFTFGSWYLRPVVDGGVAFIRVGDVQEHGDSAVSLNVRSHDSTYVSIQPAVEFGGEWRPQGDTIIRPFAKFGMTRLLSGTGQEIAATFEGDSSGVSPFTIKNRLDDTFTDVAVGLDIVGSTGTTLRMAYSGQFAKRTEGRSISLKLSIPF